MDSALIDTTLLIRNAWARTRDRWGNYVLIIIQFILLPIIIAAIISVVSFAAFPAIASQVKSVPLQVVAAIASILLPAAALFGAIYQYLVGTVALVKIVIDPGKDRKKTVAESKSILLPYVNFVTILMLFNTGLFIYTPFTLFTLLVFMGIWAQFATFSFIIDNEKGAINIWKGVQIYKENFWVVTGHAVVIQLVSILVANIGVVLGYLLDLKRSTGLIPGVMLIQIAGMICSLLFQVFAVAYMYELYARLKIPTVVKPPKIWIFFSLLGWALGLGLVAWGIQYFVSHPFIFDLLLKPRN